VKQKGSTVLEFTTQVVPEIPLAAAPLVKVLCQVRFPIIASISQSEFVAPLQEALRHEYPTMQQEHEVGLALTPQGLVPQQGGTVWRLRDASEAWQVSVAPTFVSLDTSVYTSRDDFLRRLQEILVAVESSFGPPGTERIGVRYIDRLTGELASRSRLTALVRPELLSAEMLHTGPDVTLDLAVTEAKFRLPDEVALTARWGIIPPETVVLPDMEPLDEASWILDVDVSTQRRMEFEGKELTERARQLCEHAYGFFRLMVTDEFLKEFKETG
jgi:uncharacterized protein (TIGR04255 family)